MNMMPATAATSGTTEIVKSRMKLRRFRLASPGRGYVGDVHDQVLIDDSLKIVASANAAVEHLSREDAARSDRAGRAKNHGK